MKKVRIHEMEYEAPAFEDFIVCCLSRMTSIVFEYEDMSIKNFSCVAPNGIPGFIEGFTLIEIKYGSNLKIIEKSIASSKNKEVNICYIGMWMDEYNDGNIFVFGYSFVSRLANDNPDLWWSFAGAYDPKARIEPDYNENKAYLLTSVLGFGNKPVSISFSDIDKISSANEYEFKRLVKLSQKDPAIFIGNGVSIPFGSDGWDKLCSNLLDCLSPFYVNDVNVVLKTIGDSTFTKTFLTKNTLSKDIYYNTIWHSINRKYEPDKMHHDNTLIRSICKAKLNHINMPMVTYNYDLFVENDYSRISPVRKLTSVATKSKLNNSVEPRIVHLHGRLSKNPNARPISLVLTDDEYYKTYNHDTWIKKLQKELLTNNTCLFVGSSLSDLFQLSIIESVRKASLPKMWKCFALICIRNATPIDKLTIINYYLCKGIYIIFEDDFNKLPKTLDSLLNY